MGFKNRWYTDGFKNSIEYTITPDKAVRILAPSYFLATKLEAFNTRGKEDGYISKDFEDIVYVFENRDIVWAELRSANEDVKQYLIEEFERLLNHKNLTDWISYHVQFKSPPPTEIILRELKEFTKKK